MSFSDIWRILDDLLDQGRASHCRRFAESRHPHCLLCCPRGFASRQTVGGKSRPATGPTAAPGFVDLSCPHPHHHRHGGGGGGISGGGNSTSGSDTPPTNTLFMNGHITGATWRCYSVKAKDELAMLHWSVGGVLISLSKTASLYNHCL